MKKNTDSVFVCVPLSSLAAQKPLIIATALSTNGSTFFVGLWEKTIQE